MMIGDEKKMSRNFFCFIAFITSVFILFAFSCANAQEKKEKVSLQHGAHFVGNRTDTSMTKWRDYRSGQFIHWGLYSILEGKWNNKHYDGAAEWIRSWKELPHQVYDSLIYRFNPLSFHPEQWAAMAKQMGIKYVTVTTKHHDGFCLWPSAFTNFTVANSPYNKDIIGPMVEEYNKAGIDVVLYFSVLDWNNPDWRYDLKSADDSVAFNRFKQFIKNQLTELLTRYPSVKGLWFDGTWDNSWKKSGAFSDSLEQYLKSIHPGIIIGSRLRADENGSRGFDSNGDLMGDYEQGWERKIPKTFAEVHGNDWECVMTIPENGWGYAEKWLGHWKSGYEVLEMMAQTVSLGGNFVLNFGPKANGSFRPEEIKIAKEIGNWMKKNNEAIYNCEYAGWQKQDWGYFTQKRGSGKVYMIVFNMPLSGNFKIVPVKNKLVEKVFLLQAPGHHLTIEKVDNGIMNVQLPFINQTEPFVIVIETKGK